MPVRLAADTVHTIVVLDGSSGLQVDALTDAVGNKVMPMGGPNTGFGGTALRPSSRSRAVAADHRGRVAAGRGRPDGLRRSRRAGLAP